MNDVTLFLDQLSEANEKYELAEAYYRGAPPEIFSNRRIAQLLGVNDGQFKENFSSIPVEAMASRMRINGFTVADNEAATNFLSDLWVNSKMHTEIAGCIRDWCKYGEGIIEVGYTDEGELDICPAPVTTCQIVYDPEDLRVKLFFGKLTFTTVYLGNEAQELKVVTLKYSDRIERWVETYPGSDEFMEDYEEEDGAEFYDFGEVPAFHFRNETPFGTPEHLQAYGAQDQIVKIIMNEMGVIDYTGLPQRFRILEATSPNGTSDYGTPGTRPESSESTLNINEGLDNNGPGSMLVFPGGGSVGTFESGEISGFIEAKEAALRSMAVLTNTPIRFFSDPGGQHPSGESLRASDARFRSKIYSRQESYGYTLASVFELVLRLAGYSNFDFPNISWMPQAIDDSVDALEVARKKVNLGVPRYYALIELGYTEEMVKSWGYSPETKGEPVTNTTTYDLDN